jgi:hypothetical protein
VCLSAAQFQKLKENQNFLTILFNISLLGDRGQEDRNSRRGRESEHHRQTRKLETRAKKSKKDNKIQRDPKKIIINKSIHKTIPKVKRNGSGIVVVTITKIPSYINQFR